MHFHWDNFDSLISKTLRSIAPPLINLVLVSYIFYAGMGTLASLLLSRIPNFTGSDNNVNLEKIPEFINGLLPFIIEKFLPEFEIENLGSSASGLVQFFEALFNSALTAMVGIIFGVLILSYIIDFAVRALGFLIPIRANLNERHLVNHESLDRAFNQASITDNSRYIGWLSARIKAESLGKDSSYYDVRSRLLAATSVNERAFSYLSPYLVFSLISAYWDPGGGIALIVLVLIAAAIILSRQFAIGCEIITNDLETFTAMTLTAEDRSEFKASLPTSNPIDQSKSTWLGNFQLFPIWITFVSSSTMRPDTAADEDLV